jgi:hypothetical protein
MSMLTMKIRDLFEINKVQIGHHHKKVLNSIPVKKILRMKIIFIMIKNLFLIFNNKKYRILY